MNDKGVDKNIVVEIVDTAGQEEFSAGLHDKVCFSSCILSVKEVSLLISLSLSLFDKEKGFYWFTVLLQRLVLKKSKKLEKKLFGQRIKSTFQ